MRTDLTDTPEKIQDVLIEGYRKMSPEAKMRLVDNLTVAIQRLAFARIRRQYPSDSERDCRLRLGALGLGRETTVRVFGWDPDEKGY